jgi:hypothetical protein
MSEKGTSIPSTLSGPFYVAKLERKRCPTCGRGPNFHQGCSMLECPMRRVITARPSMGRRPGEEE